MAPSPVVTSVRRLTPVDAGAVLFGIGNLPRGCSGIARARPLEMLHDLRAQGGLLLGAPGAKTLARLEAELVLRDQRLEIGRRAGAALRVGQHGPLNRH